VSFEFTQATDRRLRVSGALPGKARPRQGGVESGFPFENCDNAKVLERVRCLADVKPLKLHWPGWTSQV
jgi:hypothetical protein